MDYAVGYFFKILTDFLEELISNSFKYLGTSSYTPWFV